MFEKRTIPERLFQCRGFEVVVRHPSAETLDWAEEFFAPWFTTRTAPIDPGAPGVDVSVQDGRFRSWMKEARPLRETTSCFTLDEGNGSLPLLCAEGGGVMAVDRVHRFALAVRKGGRGRRRVDVLAELERPGARMALIRVVRELATAHAARSGELLLHSGAVATDTGITAFIGDKMAGKSTLLVHALQQVGTKYVANDRIWVRLGADEVTTFGVPTIVSLRDGTLGLSEPLRENLVSQAWHWSSTIAEALANRKAGRPALGRNPQSPSRVSPAQLCELLGVQATPGGALRRIVFPEIVRDGGTASFSLERLSVAEGARRLLESGLFAAGRLAPFLTDAPTRGPEEHEASIRELASRVSCLHCRLGPDAYGSPSVWEAIRDFSG